MTWFPEDHFSDAEIERLRSVLSDRQRENPNFSRSPRKNGLPLRFYRGKHNQ